MEKQPTRSSKQREDRRYDKTQLRAKSHGVRVHRDYAAHFFRWAFISRKVTGMQTVLDIGCGQDVPLPNIMANYPDILPSVYVGVDLNRIDSHVNRAWCTVVDQFSFPDDYLKLWQKAGFEKDARFDVGVSCEVIEHMAPVDGRKLLKGAYHWIKNGGTFYLSTPVFDGKAAVNHIHEYTIPELQKMIESVGWKVEKRWGTFANIVAIKKVAKPDELAVMNRIGAYYNNEVLSTLLAPLYPDHSRNNLWVLRK
jgi:2-polyprenyl-3-methyl-5-hydroxy-6-metoxy-1,4-benzoquinol methylase